MFEEQHDRIVPGAGVSEEIGAVRAYRDDLRAVSGEEVSTPDLQEQYCSYQPCNSH